MEQVDTDRLVNKAIGQYEFVSTLGTGTFAVVMLAKDRKTGDEVAIKVVKKANVSPKQLAKIHREVCIMRKLKHPHICRLHEVFETPSSLYIVMEYASGGELYDYLINGKMKERDARTKFLQILSAVRYCHRQRVIHRDLKPENILLDDNMDIKVADFGFGNFYDPNGTLETYCGTPAYAAPELFQGQKYIGPEVDVWSLGAILYVMVTSCVPFEGSNLAEMRASVCSGRVEIPHFISPTLADLIRRMLVVDRTKRKSIDAFLDHPWLNEDGSAPARMVAIFADDLGAAASADDDERNLSSPELDVGRHVASAYEAAANGMMAALQEDDEDADEDENGAYKRPHRQVQGMSTSDYTTPASSYKTRSARHGKTQSASSIDGVEESPTLFGGRTPPSAGSYISANEFDEAASSGSLAFRMVSSPTTSIRPFMPSPDSWVTPTKPGVSPPIRIPAKAAAVTDSPLPVRKFSNPDEKKVSLGLFLSGSPPRAPIATLGRRPSSRAAHPPLSALPELSVPPVNGRQVHRRASSGGQHHHHYNTVSGRPTAPPSPTMKRGTFALPRMIGVPSSPVLPTAGTTPRASRPVSPNKAPLPSVVVAPSSPTSSLPPGLTSPTSAAALGFNARRVSSPEDSPTSPRMRTGRLSLMGSLIHFTRRGSGAATSSTSSASSSLTNSSDAVAAAAVATKPRVIHFMWSSATTSTKNVVEIITEIERAVVAINAKIVNSSVFVYRITPASESCVLEMEICRLPRLQHVHGLRFKRVSGRSEAYKGLSEQLLGTMRL